MTFGVFMMLVVVPAAASRHEPKKVIRLRGHSTKQPRAAAAKGAPLGLTWGVVIEGEVAPRRARPVAPRRARSLLALSLPTSYGN